MTSRQAIYHRDDEKLRAVNVSGRWQVQRHDGSKGTREHSPWYPVGAQRDEPPVWPGVTVRASTAGSASA